MTNDEIIKYAKSVGLDNIDEVIKTSQIDEKTRKLFDEAVLFSNLSKAVNSEDSEDNTQVERALLPILDMLLQEGDINGIHINQENLNRLNRANLLALLFFKHIKKFESEPPSSNRSFAQTFIHCEGFSIEDEKAKNRNLFNHLMETIDEINIMPTDGNTILISIGVNNIWCE